MTASHTTESQFRLGVFAARAFALPFVTLYDIGIACWEAKYTYWAIRPFQLDPGVKPVFATPNHPSYPAAHACASISAK